jgi:hypothetical protein
LILAFWVMASAVVTAADAGLIQHISRVPDREDDE